MEIKDFITKFQIKTKEGLISSMCDGPRILCPHNFISEGNELKDRCSSGIHICCKSCWHESLEKVAI
jgi:hypothetical protein